MTTCSNGYVIDTAGQKITDGQNIQLASYNGAKSQSWRFTKLSPVIKDGTYILQSSLAKVKAVDIYGGYTVAGTNIELFDAHSGAGQQWEITYNVATDDYSLYNSHTNKYLDLYGGYTQSGTNVQTWHGNDGCGQRCVSKKKVMVRTLLFQPVTVAKLSTSMVDILKIAPIFSFGINMAVIHKSGISQPSKAQRDAPNSAKTSSSIFCNHCYQH